MKLLILLIMMTISISLLASDFKLIANINERAVLDVLKEVENDLPDYLKQNINRKVLVNFLDLNKHPLDKFDETCSGHIILGRDRIAANNNTIEIDNIFTKELKKGNRKINCIHKSIKKYFKATVVHELAHMYDQSKRISKNPLFLNIGGWVSKGFLFKRRINLNQLDDRSPDRYELKSKEETFAVNFEHFLYDQNYKCRRPTYYEFYAKEFQFNSSFKTECKFNNKIVLTSEAGVNETSIRQLDFKQLYQIHYLFAGKGSQMMSRFGHAMYRLVFCAPGKAKGPDCMNDLSSHVVVSFRANIQDITMSYMKGLRGEYPSQLFFLPFPDVVNEYTKGEFREMSSLPLKLNGEQKQRFLNRLSELYWSYSGKYYFLTNNCATEAMNLLRVALKENDDVQTKSIISPIGLFQYLEKTNLVDQDLLSNLTEAKINGYYFPSVNEKIKTAFDELDIDDPDLQSFLKHYDSTERFDLYRRKLTETNDKTKIAANALRVEDTILYSKQQALTKLIGTKVLNAKATDKLNSEVKAKFLMIKDITDLVEAENFLSPGYGVPLWSEFDTIPSDKIIEVLNKLDSIKEDFNKIIKEFFPKEFQEIVRSQENKNKLLKIMSESLLVKK